MTPRTSLGHIRDEFDPLGIGPICRRDQEDWPCPFVQGRAAALADAKAAVEAEVEKWRELLGSGPDETTLVPPSAVLAAIDELAR